MPRSSVKGLRKLEQKLSKLDKKLAVKALKSASMQATTPAMKLMKSAAPKSRSPHRTYKGRLVAPGFLSRNIKRHTYIYRGRAKTMVGVMKEAYYGVSFVEPGTKPHRIPKEKIDRRRGGAWRKKALSFNGRVVSHVNHPGSRKRPWFVRSFIQAKPKMIDKFSDVLRKKIEAI